MALELLGKLLIRNLNGKLMAVRLTEVEAYLGIEDPACHTYRGRNTDRVKVMWGEAGHAYVYMIYGMHYCLNVVTERPGVPQAVLVRGGIPVLGEEEMAARRNLKIGSPRIADGPGKLCQAMSIDLTLNGCDLCDTESGLWIADDGLRPDENHIARLPRVGVDYAGEAAKWPLRFVWKPDAIRRKK